MMTRLSIPFEDDGQGHNSLTFMIRQNCRIIRNHNKMLGNRYVITALGSNVSRYGKEGICAPVFHVIFPCSFGLFCYRPSLYMHQLLLLGLWVAVFWVILIREKALRGKGCWNNGMDEWHFNMFIQKKPARNVANSVVRCKFDIQGGWEIGTFPGILVILRWLCIHN